MSEVLPDFPDASEELTPLSIIRTETALSRFPIHRLSKKGDVQIEIRNQAAALLWEVTYNSKYGQPGPLAYKLDSLVINKRIEEAGHPKPRLLRLGSLRDICRELGNSEGGVSTQAVRNALLQNASAFINAKITYKTTERAERFLEASFTRYSVLFTGEALPNGMAADAIYILLNEPYWQVMDAALTRPLDYNYMHSLPPAAQRFYEIVSYQIYGALFYQNERARLRYSEYCMLSTAMRYLTFDQVKKQMYKIHRPHLDSGYLAKVSFEQITDDSGQADWWMYYIPGPNASREYQEFTGNIRKSKSRGQKEARKRAQVEAPLFLRFPESGAPSSPPALERKVTDDGPQKSKQDPDPGTKEAPDAATAALIAELTAADLNREVAERYARERPEESRRQLSYLPFVTEFTTSRGAYLRRAIEQGFAPPRGFVQQQKEHDDRRKKRSETELRKAAEAARMAAEMEKSRQTAESLARLENEAPEAFTAFRAYLTDQRLQAESQYAGMPTSIKQKALKIWDTVEKQQEVFRAWEALPQAKNPSIKDPLAPTQESVPSPGPVIPSEDPAAIRSLIEHAFKPASDDE